MTGKYMHCLVLSTLLLAGCGSDASEGGHASDQETTCAEGCVKCDNGVCLDGKMECPSGCQVCDDDGKCLDNKEDDPNNHDTPCTDGCVKCDDDCVNCDNGVCLDDVGGKTECPAGCSVCDDDGKCLDNTGDETNACKPACGPHQVCQSGSCVVDTVNHACSQCTKGQTCVDAQCVSVEEACARCGDATKCVGGICYDKDTMVHTGCLNCREDQVCRNNRCIEPTSFCATCAPNERCDGTSCVPLDDPCMGCSAEQSCVDNTCVDCETTLCSGVCCAEGEGCDLYNGLCMPISETTGKPPCDGFYCPEDYACSERGKCERQCVDGRKACTTAQICCKEGYECYNDSYCRVVCDDKHVMCGEAKSEICCDEGLVCYENGCHIACDETQGTRCGANYEFCCDNSKEVCVFDKCLEPTSPGSCKDENDCDYWSTCDVSTHRCVSADANENACIYVPPTGVFEPKIKWQYRVPDANGVVQTPMVINMTDDNNDGKIDQNDIPDVVFVDNNYTLNVLSGDKGTLIARTDASQKGENYRIYYNRHNEVGVADIDNDGIVDVMVGGIGTSLDKNKLYIMNLVKNEDSYQWVQKASVDQPAGTSFIQGGCCCAFTGCYWSDYHPTIANLDGSEYPSVITTQGILDGKTVKEYVDKGQSTSVPWKCNWPVKLPNAGAWYHSFFSVADLDQDGEMEIISDHIFDKNCQIAMNKDSASFNRNGSQNKQSYWYTAVADLVKDDNDPNWPGELVPEIVRVRSGFVSVWKVYKTVVEGKTVWKQRLVWESEQSSRVGGGNPVIGDFDGVNGPDIGVAGELAYSVFNGQSGQMVWASKTKDASSNKTGSSVFDFEGDGIAEVVYRDEQKIRIYSGKPSDEKNKLDNGKEYTAPKILWEQANTSGTVIENPIIVDVDNDGRTEIVVVDEGTPSRGITVYADSSDNWVRTRRIWNQHAYHVTNINEDGSVPKHEEANWLNPHLNNYRMNVQPSVHLAPDFVAGEFTYALDKCDTTDANKSRITLIANVRNAGSLGVSAPIAVSFYTNNYIHTDGETYTVYLGTVYAEPPLSAGSTKAVSLDWDMKGTLVGTETTVTLNPEKIAILFSVDDAYGNEDYVAFNECIENNNVSTTYSIEACPNGPIY